MELRAYLKQIAIRKGTEVEKFADRCETTVGQLRQVAGKHRRAGEKLAVNIERESAGNVSCETLRPDVDWAYLRQR